MKAIEPMTARIGWVWILGVGVLLGGGVVFGDRAFTEKERNHWALQPIRQPKVPEVRAGESANPIDRFWLARLEKEGLAPSPAADRRTLLRRASLDLIGLPPTPEEIDSFMADESPEAFERVVDRLLLSPHYGERWARHWLDLARYAESEGFKADETRPNAWRYRDYVIKSFNDDKGYDRFLMEQIAGDELWPDDPEARVATGFNRHYPDESNARNLMQRRQEILNDITDTAGAVFTGMTYACARCHDHKFDPILHKDYYRLQAFFANTAADDNMTLESPERQAEYDRQLAQWEEATREIRDEMEALAAPKRDEIIRDYVEKYPEEIQAALAKKAEERSPFEAQMVAKAELYVKPASHQYIANNGAVAGKLKGEEKKRWEALTKELKKSDHLLRPKLPVGTGVRDLGEHAPKTYVLAGGAWNSPLEEVRPGFLSILSPAETPIVPSVGVKSSGRRSALARVLVAPENPLPARVIVNRIWQHHFGKGLSETPSDFGMKGERPTHPELLDWLASEFVRDGWSMKRLHRRILLSQVYRQTSTYRAEAAERDPENRTLWRFPRQRLEGETIRDAALHVAGLLNPALGGPSVFPDLPSGMNSYGGWKANAPAAERNRRSIYVFVRRNMRYPMFETFDMPDTHESCGRRNCTTSPLQALSMMNSRMSFEWAEGFANRIASRDSTSAQIRLAYTLAYGRPPTEDERRLADGFLTEQSQIAASTTGPEKARMAALTDFCHMLLNSNEFVYRD